MCIVVLNTPIRRSRCHLAGGARNNKIASSSGKAVQNGYAKHTARLLGSWKKYFSRFLQYTWTCCTCIISAVELKIPITESSEDRTAS